jgi:hypothetical protein
LPLLRVGTSVASTDTKGVTSNVKRSTDLNVNPIQC